MEQERTRCCCGGIGDDVVVVAAVVVCAKVVANRDSCLAIQERTCHDVCGVVGS